MVIESLIGVMKAEKIPPVTFFYGFLFTTIAIFLSYWVFENQAGLVVVFLVVMSSFPLMYSTIKCEEKKDMKFNKELTLLEEHSKALLLFLFLFLGITTAVTFWYVFLPASLSQKIFVIQTSTITQINQLTSGVGMNAPFIKIFLNNFKVLVLSILFAFLYGVGAIFILTWNASVIGVALGNYIRRHIDNYAATLGFVSVAHYFHIVPYSVLRYLLHGILEIMAYFTAGLAGGIISVAVIRHDFGTKKFEKIILDSSDLIFISILLLVIAAFLEVYVVPLFF